MIEFVKPILNAVKKRATPEVSTTPVLNTSQTKEHLFRAGDELIGLLLRRLLGLLLVVTLSASEQLEMSHAGGKTELGGGRELGAEFL